MRRLEPGKHGLGCVDQGLPTIPCEKEQEGDIRTHGFFASSYMKIYLFINIQPSEYKLSLFDVKHERPARKALCSCLDLRNTIIHNSVHVVKKKPSKQHPLKTGL